MDACQQVQNCGTNYGFVWQTGATKTGYSCTKVYDATTPTADGYAGYLCVPSASPYAGQLTWYPNQNAPAGLNCVQWKNTNTAGNKWSTGNHYMCAPTSVPYPNGETSQLYHYQPPTITSITPPNGPVAGGTTIVLSGTSFGTRCAALWLVSQLNPHSNCFLCLRCDNAIRSARRQFGNRAQWRHEQARLAL